MFAFPPIAIANCKPSRGAEARSDAWIGFGSRGGLSVPALSDANVVRFVDQRRWQNAAAIRPVLQRPRLEEVSKFAFYLQQLSMTDWQISKPGERLEAQKNFLQRLSIKGHDTKRGESLLGNLAGIRGLFEQHGRVILDSTNRNPSLDCDVTL